MEQVSFAWTALPSLKLRGLGTPLAEPIDYYVLRMSWVTGWSVNQLATLMQDDREEGFGPLRPSCHIFGHRREAQISAFEQLSGNPDLRYGTLWALKEVLNTKGLYRQTGVPRRWCPVCYQTWDKDSDWEPLVWSIPYVSCCPTHGCDLINACPSCGEEQNRDTPIGHRLRCESCDASLGGEGTRTERAKFYDWVDQEVFKLVAFCSTPGQQLVPADTLLQFAEEFENQARSKGILQKVRRCLGMQRGEAFNRSISLSALINFSALLGVSVIDLLSRPKEAMSAPLLDLWEGFHWLCDPFAEKNDAVRAARWLAKKVLARRGRWYIPSMRVLTTDIGVSASRLKAFDPECYGAYIDAYLKQSRPATRYTRGLAFAAARKEIDGQNPASCTHSRMWWLPHHVEKMAPVNLEDAYYASYGAIVYWRLLEHAKSHAQGAVAAKEDIRWTESAQTGLAA